MKNIKSVILENTDLLMVEDLQKLQGNGVFLTGLRTLINCIFYAPYVLLTGALKSLLIFSTVFFLYLIKNIKTK